jgi:GDP-L-fucose synthase
VIEAAADFGTRKLLFLGSSCIYPKFAPQPIREDALLTSALEPTNEAYAVAKITGIKLCQAYVRQYGKDFICAMPTNLYGPGDNFDLNSSHVLPALLRKVHEAKLAGAREVVVWGTGTPRREFLHVADLASACRFLVENYDQPEIVNVGFGEDVTIRELAETICDVVGFQGELVFDTAKPDGTPRKLLDSSRLLGLGWKPQVGLRQGIAETYDWYLKKRGVLRLIRRGAATSSLHHLTHSRPPYSARPVSRESTPSDSRMRRLCRFRSSQRSDSDLLRSVCTATSRAGERGNRDCGWTGHGIQTARRDGARRPGLFREHARAAEGDAGGRSRPLLYHWIEHGGERPTARGEHGRGQIAIGHNGNLVNAAELREELEQRGSIFQTTVDSEIIVHLLAQPSGPNGVLTALCRIQALSPS